MDEKVKSLQNDLDTLNPRSKIEQVLLPRLERTRENFSVEPQIFTRRGKRILRRPNLSSSDHKHDTNSSYDKLSKSYFLTQPSLSSYNTSPSRLSSRSINSKLNDTDLNFGLGSSPTSKSSINLKPIIHYQPEESLKSLSKLKITHEAIRKSVNFNDDIDYRADSNNNNKLKLYDY
jgi:hypothetical protein